MRTPDRRAGRPIIALATLFFGAPLVSLAAARAGAQTGVHAGAQTITIHMRNGKSGKPMRDRSLRVEFQGSPANSTLTFDKHGNAYLNVPPGATAVSLIAATRGKGSTQPAYTVCGPFGQFIPIKDIVQHGFVPQDACSATLHLSALPGELLYLIEPLPWYNPALR